MDKEERSKGKATWIQTSAQRGQKKMLRSKTSLASWKCAAINKVRRIAANTVYKNIEVLVKGRPTRRWEQDINDWMDMTTTQAGRLAEDRILFRQKVQEATSRQEISWSRESKKKKTSSTECLRRRNGDILLLLLRCPALRCWPSCLSKLLCPRLPRSLTLSCLCPSMHQDCRLSVPSAFLFLVSPPFSLWSQGVPILSFSICDQQT